MVLLQRGASGHLGCHQLSPEDLQICCPAMWVTSLMQATQLPYLVQCGWEHGQGAEGWALVLA